MIRKVRQNYNFMLQQWSLDFPKSLKYVPLKYFQKQTLIPSTWPEPPWTSRIVSLKLSSFVWKDQNVSASLVISSGGKVDFFFCVLKAWPALSAWIKMALHFTDKHGSLLLRNFLTKTWQHLFFSIKLWYYWHVAPFPAREFDKRHNARLKDVSGSFNYCSDENVTNVLLFFLKYFFSPEIWCHHVSIMILTSLTNTHFMSVWQMYKMTNGE